jgi:hypothetical protein
MTEGQEKAKRDEMEQEERVKKGQRRRLFSGKESPNAGKIQISRGGAIYQVQKNGSLKRLNAEATKAVYQELADNPIEKECGALLHGFYCNVCGCTRNEPCPKVQA